MRTAPVVTPAGNGRTRRRGTGPSVTTRPPCNAGGRTSGRKSQCGGATEPRRPQLGPPTGETAGYATGRE
ncbi:hypothetical protein GCM10010340_37700 [Streptomyces griseoloalbus]|nr:hypothetical protein GCM10010340_37700 [Streptomyces albaduncus]